MIVLSRGLSRVVLMSRAREGAAQCAAQVWSRMSRSSSPLMSRSEADPTIKPAPYILPTLYSEPRPRPRPFHCASLNYSGNATRCAWNLRLCCINTRPELRLFENPRTNSPILKIPTVKNHVLICVHSRTCPENTLYTW